MVPRIVCSALIATLALFSRPSARYDQSIRPLSWTTDIYDMFGESVDHQEVKNHCTTWAYHKPNDPTVTHWITAAHCVLDENTGDYQNRDYQIDGHPVYVEHYLWPTDIASLSAYGVDAPGLILGSSEPDVVDPEQPANNSIVVIRGFPFGYSQMFTMVGYMAIKHWHDPVDPEGVYYNVYAAPTAGGNSGSPVFNAKNEVVGLLQVGWGHGFSSVSGGLDLATIRLFMNWLP